MRIAVLSACLAAGTMLATADARAGTTDCDLFCHLQGYLGSDHMTTQPTAEPAAVGGTPAKHRAHAAAKTQHPVHSAPAAAATREPAPPKDPPPARAKAAAATAEPKPAAPMKAAAAAPVRAPRHAARATPPKDRVVAAVPAAEPAAPPAAVAAPAHEKPRATRLAKATPRPAETDGLIPGSARLVPAEFQLFRAL